MTTPYELTLDNELSIDADGWALIAPFGDHAKTRMVKGDGEPTEERYIQVMDNEAADNLLSKENTLLRRIKRALVGIPIFRSHPDLARHSPGTVTSNVSDENPVGVIDNLRKDKRGIEAHINLLPAGADAVENDGCKFPSSLWQVQTIGERSGAKLVRPIKLISLGLTANPNIFGVDSLANAKANTPAARIEIKDQTNNDMIKILGWLAAQGITLANEATDNHVIDALSKLLKTKTDEAVALANERTTLANEKLNLEKKLADSQKALTDATEATKTTLANEASKVTEAIVALANERKGRAEAHIDWAIMQGKFSVAERDDKILALCNSKDIEADIKNLIALAPTHKTTASQAATDRKGDSTAPVNLANCADMKSAVDALVASGKSKVQAIADVIVKAPKLYNDWRLTGSGKL